MRSRLLETQIPGSAKSRVQPTGFAWPAYSAWSSRQGPDTNGALPVEDAKLCITPDRDPSCVESPEDASLCAHVKRRPRRSATCSGEALAEHQTPQELPR